MKIRICDDSIRLRLERDEVEQVGSGATVTCATHFPDGGQFRYCLGVGDVATATASFEGGCIQLTLPHAVARHWAQDDTEVSIDVLQSLTEGSLRLLVEKDFECLEPRAGEDQANRFLNPKAVT